MNDGTCPNCKSSEIIAKIEYNHCQKCGINFKTGEEKHKKNNPDYINERTLEYNPSKAVNKKE